MPADGSVMAVHRSLAPWNGPPPPRKHRLCERTEVCWVSADKALPETPPVGFEPTTGCLEGSCSIRLS